MNQIKSLAGTGKNYVRIELMKVDDSLMHYRIPSTNGDVFSGILNSVPAELVAFVSRAAEKVQSPAGNTYAVAQATTIGYNSAVHVQGKSPSINRGYGVAVNLSDPTLKDAVNAELKAQAEALAAEAEAAKAAEKAQAEEQQAEEQEFSFSTDGIVITLDGPKDVLAKIVEIKVVMK